MGTPSKLLIYGSAILAGTLAHYGFPVWSLDDFWSFHSFYRPELGVNGNISTWFAMGMIFYGLIRKG